MSNNYTKNITVTCIKSATIMYIEIDKLLSLNNIILQNLIKEISNKANLLSEKIDYLSIKKMRSKIATFLYNTYNELQTKTFNIKFNREELANFLNVSRPSMSRELSRMRNEKIIDYNKYSFHILDINKLIKYVE